MSIATNSNKAVFADSLRHISLIFILFKISVMLLLVMVCKRFGSLAAVVAILALVGLLFEPKLRFFCIDLRLNISVCSKEETF